MTISGYRVGYNTLDTPLVADNRGRMIDGRSFDLVLATAPQVRAAADRSDLILVPAGTEPSGGPADAALARFATVEGNAQLLADFDRQPLADFAAANGVDVADGPNKAELVARIALLDPLPPVPALEAGGGEFPRAAEPPAAPSEAVWTPPSAGTTAEHMPADDNAAPADTGGEPKPANRRTTRKAK